MPYIYMFAAILAAAFMAGVMVNDRLFLSAGDKPVLSDPMQMLVISSFLPAVALLWALSGGGLPSIPVHYMIGAFFVGTLWTVSNAAYFQVTKMTTDFDEVTTWDASSPVFMALIGVPFGIALTPRYWAGILVVTCSLLALRYAFKGRAKVENVQLYYGLLFVHLGALTGTMFGFDYLLKQLGPAHYASLYVPYLGGQTVGFLALLSGNLRQNFRMDGSKIKRLWWALLAGEVMYVLSLSCLTWAMKGYPGAVVMALGGSYPFMIFMAGPVLRRAKFFQRFGDVEVAFPPHEGQRWKKALVLIANLIGLGLLAPQGGTTKVAARRVGSRVA